MISDRVENFRGLALVAAQRRSYQRSYRSRSREDPTELAGYPLLSLAASVRPATRKWVNCIHPYPSECVHSLQGAPLIKIGPLAAPVRTTSRLAVFDGCEKSSLSGSSDCGSVTSDEGVVTTPPEPILPRIIKPRKRRKKERRLAYAQKKQETQVTSTETRTRDQTDTDDVLASLVRLSLESCTTPPLPDWDPYPTQDRHGPWNSIWGESASSHWPLAAPCDASWPHPVFCKDDEDDSSGSLEIYSEIISSPYGHRDIEIRFFSSPRNSTPSSE